MTTSKTITLNKSARTQADIQSRIEAELSILPIQQLTKSPAKLKGHAIAMREWKFITGLYGETLAQLISAFDETLLVNYCLLVEEIGETEVLRTAALKMLDTLNKKQKGRKSSDTELAGSIEYIASAVFKTTNLLNRQRELLIKYSKDLYLTPKARAGVAPPMRPAPVTPSEMADILGDAGL